MSCCALGTLGVHLPARCPRPQGGDHFPCQAAALRRMAAAASRLTSTSLLPSPGCSSCCPDPPFPLQPGLPPHDFSVTSPPFPIPAPSRWAASNWPAKILGQIELVRQQHLEDEEKFRKIQLMDQNNFQEKLEGLQVRLGSGRRHTHPTPHTPLHPSRSAPCPSQSGGAVSVVAGQMNKWLKECTEGQRAA